MDQARRPRTDGQNLNESRSKGSIPNCMNRRNKERETTSKKKKKGPSWRATGSAALVGWSWPHHDSSLGFLIDHGEALRTPFAYEWLWQIVIVSSRTQRLLHNRPRSRLKSWCHKRGAAVGCFGQPSFRKANQKWCEPPITRTRRLTVYGLAFSVTPTTCKDTAIKSLLGVHSCGPLARWCVIHQ